MKRFAVLGSHPLLSLAELCSVLGGKPPLVMDSLVLFAASWDGDWLHKKIAGVTKFGEVIMYFPLHDISILPQKLTQFVLQYPRQKRVLFGLTSYGKNLRKLGMQFKKELFLQGLSSRWVTGENGNLTPSAVSKLRLTQDGYDFVIAVDERGKKIYVGLTTHVQDADAWSLRDYHKPFRDAATGMLPPKLARMMVNIGCGSRVPKIILDPFCGSGTVLIEAAMTTNAELIGSDHDKKQIDGTRRNLDWSVAQHLFSEERQKHIRLFVQQAETIHQTLKEQRVELVVTEGYLGRPLQGNETREWFLRQKHELENLWLKTLFSLRHLQKPRDRIVCILPEWQTKYTAIVVGDRIVAEIPSVGYRLIDPLEQWPIDQTSMQLIYARPGQRVKRGIVILERT